MGGHADGKLAAALRDGNRAARTGLDRQTSRPASQPARSPGGIAGCPAARPPSGFI